MKGKIMAIDFKKILQEVIVPDLQEIKSRLGTVEVEIKRLEQKIDLGDARLDEKIEGVKEDVQGVKEDVRGVKEDVRDVKDDVRGVKEEMRGMREEFRLAIDIHERLAALEARLPRQNN